MDRFQSVAKLVVTLESVSESRPKEARIFHSSDALLGGLDRNVVVPMLAAALCALKLSNAEEDTGCSVKAIIFKIVGNRQRFQKLWRDVCAAELQMYHVLGYRIAVPSIADISSHIVVEMASVADSLENCLRWPGFMEAGMPFTEEKVQLRSFAACHAFLVELALVHAPHEIYAARSPMTVALAIAHLALFAFGKPPTLVGCRHAWRSIRSSWTIG